MWQSLLKKCGPVCIRDLGQNGDPNLYCRMKGFWNLLRWEDQVNSDQIPRTNIGPKPPAMKSPLERRGIGQANCN